MVITALEFDIEKRGIANMAFLIERVNSGEEGVVLSHGGLGFCRVKGRLGVLGKRGGYLVSCSGSLSLGGKIDHFYDEVLEFPSKRRKALCFSQFHLEETANPDWLNKSPLDRFLHVGNPPSTSLLTSFLALQLSTPFGGSGFSKGNEIDEFSLEQYDDQ
ncbi:hypothetical protein Tco_0581927 [Tanacetum coccineum]